MARRAMTSLGLGLAGLALLAATVSVGAQDAGDRVVVTLKSGKTYQGTLVSRSDDEIVLKIGGADVTLPGGMVAGVERAAAAAPAPEAGPAARAPAGKSPARGAPAPADPAGPAGAPRKNAVLLKDGTVLEGYALSRDADGTVWFIEGVARPLAAADVDEVMGEIGSGGGDGLVFTGDAAKDSFRLIKELGAKEADRGKTAAALLEQYGTKAEPALLKGLKDENGMIRRKCLGLLKINHTDAALGPILQVLKEDNGLILRSTAAAILADWNSPRVRNALLEAAWRDREDAVKASAVESLKRHATIEEASGLMDLLLVLPPESEARKGLFEALRRATAKKTGDDATLWSAWWNEQGGREETFAKVNRLLEERAKAEYGGGR